MIKLYIAFQIQLAGLIMLPQCLQWHLCSMHGFVIFAPCVHIRKNSHSALFASVQAWILRDARRLTREQICTSDATHNMVLKQATQRALFRPVTFSAGWSRSWKNVWAKNAFPVIIQIFFFFQWICKRINKNCYFMVLWPLRRLLVCVKCTTVRRALSFTTYTFTCARWTMKAVVLFSRK